LKIELNGGLQSLSKSRDSIQTLQTKTPHNFHLINQNGMIQSFPCIYKSIESTSVFLKEIFEELFLLPRLPTKQGKLHIIQ